LQIHQDHIGAAGLQRADAFGNLLLETLGVSAPGHIVGPELPYDEIGLEGKNIAAEAGDAARDGFADPALLTISMRAAGRSLASSRRKTSG
jgi:hypothetical protein